ncbi:GAK system ATP-grasp enzyme [Desulfoluna spongiiphila]|uniref:SSU ribosomal protein S6P modification protein n=1 Tax=Desulfoluna spongiiphila TaxID=419481 RepID=A0A1G5ANY0_9BACT|nr:GAK system ATP-grasp enzyme [Desulfoluna spongiiphila]SCX79587.1 SSU ribosomal protein S6P modification protein [Desulfoluna spongiiphila]VVS91907.1 atp-grasp fold rimk-type [Desulfoluna spongiiphila]
MKIGVIGTPGGWSSEQLADAVAGRTGRRILISPDEIRLDLPSGRACCGDHDLAGFDALLIKKIGARYSPDLLDRLEILRYLEGRGLKVFSSPLALLRVLDRLSCTITLQLAGIPMPPTTITESVDHARDALRGYGEAILKPLYTSKARGMVFIRDEPGAGDLIRAYKEKHSILYLQKRIPLGDRDLGVAFVGGEYLATYARCRQGVAWDTISDSKEKYRAFEPSPGVIEMARRAQGLFNLSFTCVDVALTDDGPYVFEVSAFGGFRGILETSGINAAERYVDHVLQRVSP